MKGLPKTYIHQSDPLGVRFVESVKTSTVVPNETTISAGGHPSIRQIRKKSRSA